MSDELRFDGRVAIVTGAGRGLGRQHALLLAERGAKVVVNDLGGSATGRGEEAKVADEVVAEIEEAGGEAVANYDSVVEGSKIVEQAMDEYGQVDIIVNNAGILRDTSFHKMSPEDWQIVYDVHVRGAFEVTHAAWPHMREQEFGRIVMTASAAGIYGNFGQANYAMAKMGLIGFSNTLAVEGRKRNIHVNTIAPIAGSRLTKTVLPEEICDALDPAYVSPLVAWLVHDDCEETGGLFEVGGGVFTALRWERSKGKTFRLGREMTPESVKRSWSTINDFEDADHPRDINASMQPVMANINAGPSKGGNEFIDVDEALGYELPEQTSEYDEHDLALYALGVGAASDPLDDEELQLVYEMHSDGFKPLPTYGVVPALGIIMDLAREGEQAPGLNYGFDRVLHGEQYTKLERPLPKSAKLTHKARISDIWDKGKNALVVTEVKSYDEDGDLLITSEITTLVRGAGGWGGDRGPTDEVNTPPERDPDATVEEHIPENQALLYRLSGDWNPLHADPAMAKAFGFDKPILHGLCTFGFAARHVISEYSDGDPRYFKDIKVRFADSVYPGETLVTDMWKEDDQRIVFECRVKERDSKVITRAAIELYEEIPEKKVKTPEAEEAASDEPISADVFTGIRQYVDDHTDEVQQIGKVYQFKLSNPESVWTLDLAECDVAQGETTKPDCILELSDADFMAMCNGEADPQKMYFDGRLQISGDVMASQRLTFLQKVDPETVQEAARARGGGAVPPADDLEADTAAASTEEKEPQSPVIFENLSERFSENPNLAKEVGQIVQFNVTGPEATWVVDMTDGGEVREGNAAEAAAVFTIADDDLAAMVSGDSDVEDLYQRGKLRVDGDITLARKLNFMQELI